MSKSITHITCELGLWTIWVKKHGNGGGFSQLFAELWATLYVPVRVGNSLFPSSLFRSKSLSLKSICEQIALVALFFKEWQERQEQSLMAASFFKEWREQIALVALFLKSDESKSLTGPLYLEQFWAKELRGKEQIPNPDGYIKQYL